MNGGDWTIDHGTYLIKSMRPSLTERLSEKLLPRLVEGRKRKVGKARRQVIPFPGPLIWSRHLVARHHYLHAHNRRAAIRDQRSRNNQQVNMKQHWWAKACDKRPCAYKRGVRTRRHNKDTQSYKKEIETLAGVKLLNIWRNNFFQLLIPQNFRKKDFFVKFSNFDPYIRKIAQSRALHMKRSITSLTLI